MKKSFLLATTLATALCVAGTPLSAKAAGNCSNPCKVTIYSGNACNVLDQEQLYSMLGDYLSQCYPNLQFQWQLPGNNNCTPNCPQDQASCNNGDSNCPQDQASCKNGDSNCQPEQTGCNIGNSNCQQAQPDCNAGNGKCQQLPGNNCTPNCPQEQADCNDCEGNPQGCQQVTPIVPQQEKPGNDQQVTPPASQQEKPSNDQQEKPGNDQQANPPASQQDKPGNDQQVTPPASQQEKPGNDQQATHPASQQEKPGNPQQEKPVVDKSYEEQIVDLVNAERAKIGLPALKSNVTLQAAAYARAKETVHLFSHTRPNGSSCFTILKEYGISYRYAGENIAYGQRSPEEVVNAWMNSEGHRANILNKNFTTIGIGYYQTANGTKYWSQLFIS